MASLPVVEPAGEADEGMMGFGEDDLVIDLAGDEAHDDVGEIMPHSVRP